MPELPEVETVRRGLEAVMLDRQIKTATARRPDLRWPFPANFSDRLSGASVKALRRRAKYILADLDSDETLLIHLGMSGRMLIQGNVPGVFHRPISPLEKHDHVVFEMEGGVRIIFNDPRRFGAMDLIPNQELGAHKLLAKIGPEPLGNSFNAKQLHAAFSGRRAPVKAALLDQRNVAGLGNIYVCEALWAAGISPKRQAGRISHARIEALTSAVRSVLKLAIEAGGSSLRDYRQADGEMGYFQHAFKVYDREHEGCTTPDCSGKIRRIVQSGRSSFYCPTCQK